MEKKKTILLSAAVVMLQSAVFGCLEALKQKAQ